MAPKGELLGEGFLTKGTDQVGAGAATVTLAGVAIERGLAVGKQ